MASWPGTATPLSCARARCSSSSPAVVSPVSDSAAPRATRKANHLVDSMFNQHAKWLDACRHIPWRRPIASLTYLLTSHVWRQDHNGFSHQDPGFLDHVLNKKPQIVRAYLPPDANTLLSTMAHCLRTRNYVHVVVAGKQPGPQWLTMEEAIAHCTRGLGIWPTSCSAARATCPRSRPSRR